MTKHPKDYVVQIVTTPRTRNGNTLRVIVVHAISPFVIFVHAAEYEGDVVLALLPWLGGAAPDHDRSAWGKRALESTEVPVKIAKEYLARSRKLALRALDEATRTVTFVRDCMSQGPEEKGASPLAATAGDRWQVTDLVERPECALPMISFVWRGVRRTFPASAVTVSP